MIEGQTVLCFASGYDAPPTSKHHVMHQLAENNVVLWVNYHASRSPSVSSSDALWICKKLAQVARGMQNPRPNLYTLTPLVIPLPASAWAKRLNHWLVTTQIRRALRKLQQGRLQIWSFAPDINYLVDAFSPDKLVYYCVDDFAHFSGYDAQQVLRDEEQLARRADLVITTSRELQASKGDWNDNTVLISHGVEYDHFARATKPDLAEPADLANIPHPRLGFFGLIRDWVDLELLAEVARRKSDWHIVMIGDSTIDLSSYSDLPNLHFLGRRDYDKLPAYCKGFDAGLIPFCMNELTVAVNPIKLREYLSAGLPVVSTPLPEVLPYQPHVYIGQSVDGFIQAANNALSDNRLQDIAARQTAMQAETWPAKLEQISAALDSAQIFSESLLKGSPRR